MRGRRMLALAVLGFAVTAVLVALRRPRRTQARAGLPESEGEARLDEALEETFPASDPIAVGRIE